MNDREITRYITERVKQEFATLMMATVQATQTAAAGTGYYRAQTSRFGTDPGVPNQRMIQPYGFASSPPVGMETVMSPVGADPTHMIMLGQNDTARPPTQPGESVLYGPDGNVVFMKADGSIRQGVETAASPVVLGDVLTNFLNALCAIFTDTTTEFGECAVGPVYVSPAKLLQIEQLVMEYLTTPATNIVGQKNFVDRGTP